MALNGDISLKLVGIGTQDAECSVQGIMFNRDGPERM